MKEENLSGRNSTPTQPARNELQIKNSNPVSPVARRSFIKGLGIVGATLLPGSALVKGQGIFSSGKLSQGDADLLRFALWAELVESDLWTQYN